MIGVTKYFKSSLIQNTFFLFVNKGVNAFVPIILIPLCNNFFGVEQYGNLVYAQSSLFFFVILFDYGFNLSAPREISSNLNNWVKIQEVFTSIMLVKIVAFILFGLFLLIILPIWFRQLYLLFIFTYLSLSFQSLIPYWFFQGIKQNFYITIINSVSKVAFLIVVFLLIQSKSNIYYIPLLEAIASLLALLFCVIIILKKFKFSFKKIQFNFLLNQIRVGKNIFLTSLISWFIVSGSVIIIEKVATKQELGYFGTFSRICYYLYAIVQPINQAILPYASEKFAISTSNGFKYINKIRNYYLVAIVILICLSVFLVPVFFNFVFNKNFMTEFVNYRWVLTILIFWVGLYLINNFIGIQYLIASNKDKTYRNYYLVNGLVVLLGFIILIPLFKSFGAAISMCLGEISFSILWLLNSKKLFVSR